MIDESTIAHHRWDCDLVEGNVWRECLCAQIDPSDRPCDTCESIALSAKGCAGCALILNHRRPA